HVSTALAGTRVYTIYGKKPALTELSHSDIAYAATRDCILALFKIVYLATINKIVYLVQNRNPQVCRETLSHEKNRHLNEQLIGVMNVNKTIEFTKSAVVTVEKCNISTVRAED